jgi:hypothetical protein
VKDKSAVTTGSFSGHETFILRHAWLKKAADRVSESPTIFSEDEAMVKLGVGKNMVRSIRHWGLATRVLEEKPRTRGMELLCSGFGKLVFREITGDPYLEDLNTLWLIHWNLATNQQRATTWYWAFNAFPGLEFNRESLQAFIAFEIAMRGWRMPSHGSLKRDVDCFIRTYTRGRGPMKGSTLEDSLDCPLVELELIQADPAGIYRFSRGSRPSLNDDVFAHCLVDYWSNTRKTETLAFADIAYGAASPGRVFRLDENSLIDRLDRLDSVTGGALVFGDTAGIKQVYRKKEIKTPLLTQHYGDRVGGFR